MTGPATGAWLDGFDQVRGNDAGRWATGDVGAPKIVLHRTEGSSIEGAVGAYRANNSWPHMTVDIRRRRRVQHVALTEPARALRNTSAPGETGRDRYVYQIEIVGFSAKAADDSDEDLEWFGREVLAPLAAATGTPLVTTVTFHGPGCGWTLATASARQRLSPAAYDRYTGVLAHQHIPENTHWDVGAFRIAAALAAANGTTTPDPQEFTMDAEAKAAFEALDKKIDAVRGDVWVTADMVQKCYGSLRGWLAAIGSKLGVTRAQAAAEDTYAQKATAGADRGKG